MVTRPKHVNPIGALPFLQVKSLCGFCNLFLLFPDHLFYWFLTSLGSQESSHWNRLENHTYYEVFMRPELRCCILLTPNSFWEVIWPNLWGEYIFEKCTRTTYVRIRSFNVYWKPIHNKHRGFVASILQVEIVRTVVPSRISKHFWSFILFGSALVSPPWRIHFRECIPTRAKQTVEASANSLSLLVHPA